MSQPYQPRPHPVPPYPPNPYMAAPVPPPPPQLPVAGRIPDDLPFVVRPSVGKRLAFFGAAAPVLTLIFACPVGLAFAGSADHDGALPLLVLPILVLVVCLGVFGLQVWLLASGGPVLALAPTGMWIKSRPTRGQAIWLPWELIERVYKRRWTFNKMVCVKPRDPRIGGNLGAYTALDTSMQKLVFGTGFTAPLNFADKPEAEIMGAIAHFSGGRILIG